MARAEELWPGVRLRSRGSLIKLRQILQPALAAVECLGDEEHLFPSVWRFAGFDRKPLVDSQGGQRGDLLKRPVVEAASPMDQLSEEPGTKPWIRGVTAGDEVKHTFYTHMSITPEKAPRQEGLHGLNYRRSMYSSEQLPKDSTSWAASPLVHDLENTSDDVYQDQPVVVVTEDEINIVGDQNNAIHLDPSFGILLSGKLSLSAMPDQISIGGGYWRLNPMLLSCVPSTTPTPIPVLVQSTPELFQNADAVSNAKSYLLSNSDAAS